jgi:predicted Rossmann-fold nucleotide-binding protein
MEGHIGNTCLVFPRMGRTYNVFRAKLYDGECLYDGYDPRDEESYANCFDARVYHEYLEKGQVTDDIRETLGRTLHDRAVTSAMREFLCRYDERQVVAIMGGHAQLRTDEGYRQVAFISKTLTEKGKLMASGGGPGAMEATHLGAWMAGRTQEEFEDALKILSVAPTFRDEGWLRTAFEVRKKYPQFKYNSLGIPTWFYGHEPATPFATHIAKYFYNSVREDTLLSIAKGGIIYSPGSAGTIQEIFQDAAQNHYETFGAASPMVFLGTEFFTKEVPIYPLLEDLLARGKYKNLLISITDDAQEAIDTVMAFSQKAPTEGC